MKVSESSPDILAVVSDLLFAAAEPELSQLRCQGEALITEDFKALVAADVFDLRWLEDRPYDYFKRLAHATLLDGLRRLRKLRTPRWHDLDNLTQTSFCFIPTRRPAPEGRVQLIVRARSRLLKAKASLRRDELAEGDISHCYQPTVPCANS